MITYETLTIDVDSDGVAILTISVPGSSLNVANQQFVSDLEDASDNLLNDPSIKGVIVTASGPVFLAGADLRMLLEMSEDAQNGEGDKVFESMFRFSRVFRSLETGGMALSEAKAAGGVKPIVAALNGSALGGGLEMALACHHRIGVEGRGQVGLPESTVGVMPGAGGTQRLTRLVGPQMALDLILTGRSLPMKKAFENGILDALAPADKLIEEAKQFIRANPRVLAPWDIGDAATEQNQGIADNEMLAPADHYYPNRARIRTCVARALNQPIDMALTAESLAFTECLADPQSSAMIRTLFVNKLAADRLKHRPANIERRKTSELGVVGAGMMGLGIARVAAEVGISVNLIDSDLARTEQALEKLATKLNQSVAKGRLKSEKAETIKKNIRAVSSYSELSKCDLVVEAVTEDEAVKSVVFSSIEASVSGDAIIATNTSTLPVSSLANGLKKPERFVGLHFFSPVEKMQLVEIIRGDQTSDKAIAHAMDFTAQIRKTPILVRDARGFYANRCIVPFMLEGAALVLEGVPPELIEASALATDMPMGPLALMDEVSVSLCAHIINEAIKAGDDFYGEHPGSDVVLSLVTNAKRLGRGAGAGFYEYANGRRSNLWTGLSQYAATDAGEVSPEDVQDRLLYSQLVPALHCLDAGILLDEASGDVGAILGWGFPKWTGGPFSYVEMVGSPAFTARAKDLETRFGNRFALPGQAEMPDVFATNRVMNNQVSSGSMRN